MNDDQIDEKILFHLFPINVTVIAFITYFVILSNSLVFFKYRSTLGYELTILLVIEISPIILN